MTPFLGKDFLLHSDTARTLYHQYAAKTPIYDYHCHIDPKEIYEDRRFRNLTELWLGGDHYKWRLMRSGGVDEAFITGSASDWEKFLRFAQVLPRAIGNPLYHWCHLELKNYFGFEGVLSADTAREVWDLTQQKLTQDPGFSARGLILRSNVAMVGTTDDPCSDLKYHQLLAQSDFPVKVLPSFRPDPALDIFKPGFKDYIGNLAQSAGMEIHCAAHVRKALTARIQFFDACGCRAADHGLNHVVCAEASEAIAEAAFRKAMAGQPLTRAEQEGYQTNLLLHCGREYARCGWVMQLHFNCIRDPNTRAWQTLGADSGFDCMAADDNCGPLFRLLDTWAQEKSLPRTILYSLNPTDNQWIDTMLGAFQDSSIAGKLQHGSAWWFNDNKSGMIDHLTSLANLSILGNFVGMLTDSRSFLSYARHEYFRRILCDLLGTWVENGEYPADLHTLGALVEDISAGNARRYFNL